METKAVGKVSLTPKGEYDANVSYKKLDIVRYDGSSWLVLKNITGVTPTEGMYYMLLSERGEDGHEGPQGPAGPAGDSVTVDTTLTIEGAAAEAKAVGAKFQELLNRIEGIEKTIGDISSVLDEINGEVI